MPALVVHAAGEVDGVPLGAPVDHSHRGARDAVRVLR